MMKIHETDRGRLWAAWAVASTPESYAGPQACEGGKGTDRPENALRKTFRRQETRPPSASWSPCTRSTARSSSRFRWPRWGGICCWERPRIDDVRARDASQGSGSRRRCTSRSIWRTAPWFWCGGTTPGCGRAFPERVGTAVAAVGCDNIVGQYRIKVCNDDRTAVVIDATELFCTDIPELSPIGEGYDPFDISAVMKTGLTRVTDVRSLNGELYVCTSTQYSVSEWRFIFPVAVNLPVDGMSSSRSFPCPRKACGPGRPTTASACSRSKRSKCSEEGGPVGEGEVRRTLEHRSGGYGGLPARASSRTRCARSRCTDPEYARDVARAGEARHSELNRAFEKAGFRR